MAKDKEKGTENPFATNTEWYELWMKQSKTFFDITEKNLKNLFEKGGNLHPEDHMKEINVWLENLKKSWQWQPIEEQQKAYENYSKMMSKMWIDASDMLMQQWMLRTKEKQPIHSMRELYELWLNCCHEVYTKAMHSKSYQEAYGEFMNAAVHFWKSALSK